MTETASTYDSLEIKPGWYLLLAKRVEWVLEKRPNPFQLFLSTASHSLGLLLHESQLAGSARLSPDVFCWDVGVSLPAPCGKKGFFTPCSSHLDISASSALVLMIGEDGRCLPLPAILLHQWYLSSDLKKGSCICFFFVEKPLNLHEDDRPPFICRDPTYFKHGISMKTVSLDKNVSGSSGDGLGSSWEGGEEAMGWHRRRPELPGS